MNKIHNVQAITMNERYLCLMIDGQTYRIEWADCSERLARAEQRQRQRVELAPSGYGLHWPELDEDLSITPLLQHAQRVETVP